MTEPTQDGAGPSDDFRDRVLEVLKLLKAEDPPTDKTVELAAEVAKLAEVSETPRWVITMKYFHLSALQGAGRILEAIVEFPKFRAYCDLHPGVDEGHLLLTVHKWMLYNTRLFPTIPKAAIEADMQDFEGRLWREGLSLRPLHQARMNWAQSRGHAEDAALHFREWQAAPRDRVSDCPACELNDRVEYLVFLGQDNQAVSAAEPLLAGELKCTSVPDRTYGALLEPLLRLGRLEEALDLNHEGYRRIAGKRLYVDTAAEHIIFLTRAGQLEEAAKVFQSFVPLALEDTTPPLKRFRFLLAGWLLLDGLRAAGSVLTELNLPALLTAFGRQGVSDLESLVGWLRSEVTGLAQSFDTRDETDAYSRRVAAAFDTTMRAPTRARTPPAEAP